MCGGRERRQAGRHRVLIWRALLPSFCCSPPTPLSPPTEHTHAHAHARPTPSHMSIPEPKNGTLRLGSTAPNFTTDTSVGEVTFYDYVGKDSWCILFSHPDDFTPVCTTELGAFAKLEPEFAKRNAKLIGLSVNDSDSHRAWIRDIDEITGSRLQFPIIADPERKIALLYDMIDYQDASNIDDKGVQLTIRSVFIIDPAKKIRLIMTYPASCGRNTAEVLRALDSLQTSDKLSRKITTPINWVPGDDVIIAPSLSDAEARALFPKFRAIKPYLRLTPLSKDLSHA